MQLRLHLFISFLFLLLFTVSCGDGGTGTSPNEPEIVNFAPSPTSVSPGEEVTLSWTVNNATSLSIDNGVGEVTGTSVVVNPTVTTTYTLTARNGNVTKTAETEVTVTGAPPAAGSPTITSFAATPVDASGAATLSWAVTDATSITIDNDVGDVTADPDNSVQVTPAATTTYTLTASNASGEVRSSAVVTVGTGGDTTAPTGTFGVSNTQGGTFTNDRPDGISDANDNRIVKVAPDGTFYAQVKYIDPDGITSIDINLVNRNPAGISGTLSPSQQFFTLGAPVGACDLSSTPTNVTCTYPIEVDENAVNITELDNAENEFAYVFRTEVTDTAGNTSEEGIRGYVIVEGSGDDDNDNDGGGNDDNDNPPANTDPEVEITDVSALTLSSGSATASLDATVNDDEDDSFSYQWSVTSGTESNVDFASSTAEDTDVTFSAAGDYTLQLTATDTDDSDSTGSDTVNITVNTESGTPPSNSAPTVSIADVDDLTLATDGSVEINLDATVNDDDDDTFSYEWSVTSSNAGDVSIDSATTEDTDVTFSAAGDYTLQLEVTDTDDSDSMGSDTVKVTVNEASDSGDDTSTAPTIDSFTAADATIDEGDSTTLSWSLSGDAATSITIDNGVGNVTGDDDDSVSVSPTQTTTYTLTATNAGGESKAQAIVTVTPAPSVNITPEEPGTIASSSDGFATLDLTATTENFNDEFITFAWSSSSEDSDADAFFSPAGGINSNATFATEASFEDAGTYTVTVVASTDEGERATDSISVTVTSTVEAAIAVSPTSITVGDEVTLDGSGSEGSNLTYLWSLNAPSGEGVTRKLSSTTGASVTFTPDAEGAYELTLIVEDDSGAEDSKTIPVNVAASSSGSN